MRDLSFKLMRTQLCDPGFKSASSELAGLENQWEALIAEGDPKTESYPIEEYTFD